jgi:putative membrane protein
MSQLSSGIAQLSDNKGKLYEGSAALSQGLSKLEESLPESLTVAGVTGDQNLEDILNSLAADAKVLADAMVTLKGENEWKKVFEDMQSYVTLVRSSYTGAETELAQAEAEYENLSESIADSVSSAANEIGETAGSNATSTARDKISEMISSLDFSEANLTPEQEEMIRAVVAEDLSGIDISGNVSEVVSADAVNRIESTVLAVEEQRMAHVTAAKACLDQITEAAATNKEAIEALDTETIQKAADDMKKQFLALTEYSDDMDKLNGSAISIRKMYSDLKDGIDQLATGSGQLTEGISKFNSGIDALYSGAVLLTQGTSALESYGSPLLEGASALTEGMSALHDGIKAFDEEAIQELTDLAGDDLLNLSGRIRAIKICDTSYQTFSGLAPGRKGTVKFIIETEEIVKD